MISNLAPHVTKLKFLVNSNSTTILTGVGVVGTLATAYLTGRATFKAAEIIKKEEAQNDILKKYHYDVKYDALTVKQKEVVDQLLGKEIAVPRQYTFMDKVGLVWKHYIPPGTVMIVTIACVIFAHRISTKKIAALTLASGISERALREYKEKIEQKFGESKATTVRDEIAQERVNENPPVSNEIIITDTGDVLCYDTYTGRYFKSSAEQLRRAVNVINHEIGQALSVSLSRFYDEVGLPATTYTDTVGWHSNNLLDLRISAVVSPDNRPCLAVGFDRDPVPGYDSAWTP